MQNRQKPSQNRQNLPQNCRKLPQNVKNRCKIVQNRRKIVENHYRIFVESIKKSLYNRWIIVVYTESSKTATKFIENRRKIVVNRLKIVENRCKIFENHYIIVVKSIKNCYFLDVTMCSKSVSSMRCCSSL